MDGRSTEELFPEEMRMQILQAVGPIREKLEVAVAGFLEAARGIVGVSLTSDEH
jgi:hypothetical protein